MRFVKVLQKIIHHPLTKSRPVTALSRFVRWQVSSRLSPGRIAIPFVGETFLLANTGMTTATGNYYWGLMEPSEMGFVLHMLRPGDLFADVGANIGSYTILSSGAVGSETISIEPVKETFHSLRNNVLLNGVVDRVELQNIGISSAPGSLRFTIGGDAINHVLRDGEVSDSVEIPVSTVDVVMAGRTPALIKIDVEGFELKVLEGATETLDRQGVYAVIVETNDLNNYYGATNSSIATFLEGRGFKRYSYDPVARKLEESKAKAPNSLFIRNYEEVMKRLESAPRFTLVTGEI